MKVLIVVTHLLGTGHLSRAATLARAFQDAGHETVLVSGGGQAPQLNLDGLKIVQLPPVRSDGTNFSRLLDARGLDVSVNTIAERSQVLNATAGRFGPDVLITELFPFGRRNLTPEFLSLLETVQTMSRPPVVLSSIRDILAPPSKPEKVQRADDIIDAFYTGVLVHSDPDWIQLEESWPISDGLRRRLQYTGFVAPEEPRPGLGHTDGSEEIIVSAGGGAVGRAVYITALDAAHQDSKRTWRLLVGGSDPEPLISELKSHASSANVVIEPARPDFRQLLLNAAASVSMSGYNTVLDLLQTGTPSVLIPFDDGNEVEQTRRAVALVRAGGFSCLRTEELTGTTLAKSVANAITAGRRPVTRKGMNGAAETVHIAETLSSARA